MRRTVSVLLALCLLVSLFTLTSCGSATYLTVGGEKVSYDFVKSFVHNHLASYTEEELRDEALRDEIREKVYHDLKMTFVVLVLADELNVKLTSDAKAAMKEELQYYQSLGESYEILLAQQNATEAVFKKLLEISAYENLVFDAITDGAALGDAGERFSATNELIEADLKKGDWYAAEYLVLEYDDVNKPARKEAVEKAKSALLSGSSFKDATTDIKKLYVSESVVATDAAFTSLEYTEDFENAVKALEVGGVSEILDTYTAEGASCFMLVRRIELSRTYIEEKFDTIISKYLAREYANYMTERAESLEIVTVKKYRDSDILCIE